MVRKRRQRTQIICLCQFAKWSWPNLVGSSSRPDDKVCLIHIRDTVEQLSNTILTPLVSNEETRRKLFCSRDQYSANFLITSILRENFSWKNYGTFGRVTLYSGANMYWETPNGPLLHRSIQRARTAKPNIRKWKKCSIAWKKFDGST